MTEAEWLACTDPEPMLDFLKGNASERKLRLFAVACCRRILGLLRDERSREAVRIAEEYADGNASEEAREAAHAAAAKVPSDQAPSLTRSPSDFSAASLDAYPTAFAKSLASMAAKYAAQNAATKTMPLLSLTRRIVEAAGYAAFVPGLAASDQAEANEKAAQCGLLREVIGNPVHSTAIDPSWLTPAVTMLAQTIYDNRAFDRMPELADALEQAGCTNTEVLEHCGGDGPHVGGCWVVDLILGKD